MDQSCKLTWNTRATATWWSNANETHHSSESWRVSSSLSVKCAEILLTTQEVRGLRGYVNVEQIHAQRERERDSYRIIMSARWRRVLDRHWWDSAGSRLRSRPLACLYKSLSKTLIKQRSHRLVKKKKKVSLVCLCSSEINVTVIPILPNQPIVVRVSNPLGIWCITETTATSATFCIQYWGITEREAPRRNEEEATIAAATHTVSYFLS